MPFIRLSWKRERNATLFGADGKQLTTHFFGPNPAEKGVIRASWQHSSDTSAVWAKLLHDPVSVTPNAIPGSCSRWLECSPDTAATR